MSMRAPQLSRSKFKALVAAETIQPSSHAIPTEKPIFHRDPSFKFRVSMPLEKMVPSGKTLNRYEADHTAPYSAKVSAAIWRNIELEMFSDKTCT